MAENSAFYIKPEELRLQFSHGPCDPSLSFSKHKGDPDQWRSLGKAQIAKLLGIAPPPLRPCKVRTIRETVRETVRVQALILDVDGSLSIPAYLLSPENDLASHSAIIAIHGHGEVEPCIGQCDDYHHCFALELARAGHVVLAPELRGFGSLFNLAAQSGDHLSYWGEPRSYPLATDAMQFGRCMMGETIEDLLRWEHYLTDILHRINIFVAGISYGGDLALTYPIFSSHVRGIFASGTLGSFEAIFAKGANAPAHCIPSVLEYLNRSDIAGLNAPCPVMVHYGELDIPGPTNFSAAYNESALPAFEELQRIYKAFGVESSLELHVSMGQGHEMDIPELLRFLESRAINSSNDS